MFKLIGITLVK